MKVGSLLPEDWPFLHSFGDEGTLPTFFPHFCHPTLPPYSSNHENPPLHPTQELKNPWTGRNVNQAKKQYRDDRAPKETQSNFKRCLVHFAVDPDEVWMTTKLDGKSTYLWQEILTRHSLSNIIEHYAKLMLEKNKAGKSKETLYFPRYQHLQMARLLLADVQVQGLGKRYLMHHSAGSGKSHFITWLGYQLVELYEKTGQENLFDSVIVVTDRRELDRQIDKNIRQFAEVKNILAHARSAAIWRQAKNFSSPEIR